MACRNSHRAPLHHPEFVLERETRRIHRIRRQIQCRKLMMDRWEQILDAVGFDHWSRLMMGPSKHELKECYWTEGVPFVKRTGCGLTAAAAEAEELVAN